MDIYTATMIAEGSQLPEDDAEYYAAWQFLVDTGVVWSLQGWFGRTATTMLNQGLLHPPEPASDITHH